MRTRIRFAWISVAAALSASACGDGNSGTEAARKLADSMCSLAFDCCTGNEVDYFLGHYVNEADCAERMVTSAAQAPQSTLRLDAFGAAIALPNLRALDNAMADGRVGVDAEELDACLTYLDELTCNTADELEPPGDGEITCVPPEPAEPLPCSPELLFHGRVGEGGTCTSLASGLECEEGLACRIDPNLGIEGVCVARGEVGDICFSDGECESELYCSQLDGLCHEPRAEGESCLYADPNASAPSPTTLLLECEPRLTCDPVTDLCVNRCERGAPCASDVSCDAEEGLRCVMGRCDLPRTADLPCAETADCAESLRCREDPAFEAPRVCAEPLALGEDCDPVFGSADVCASGYCNPETQTCDETVAPGELCPTGDSAQCGGGYCETSVVACTGDDQCPGSGTCNTDFGRCEFYCVEQRADGADCDLALECQSGACVAGTCRTLPLVDGQACASDFQCESGFCSLGVERVCKRLPLSNGDRCLSGGQCSSGICFDNRCVAGLGEGESCTAGALQPPCKRDLYCNPDEPEPSCRPVHAAGQECEESYQCRGECVLRFGKFICDAVPPADGAICEGA